MNGKVRSDTKNRTTGGGSTPLNRKPALLGSFALIISLSLGIVGALSLSAPPQVSAQTLSPWIASNSYPLSNENPIDCVTSQGYIYCLGGSDVNSTYFAPIASSGVGAWTQTTSYPANISYESCVASGGYIYCVSGYEAGSSAFAGVYYAPLTSSGIGAWMQTTSYPVPVMLSSCVAAEGFIYCVGGYQSPGANQDASVFYAPISATGIGTWTSTTNYPITDGHQSCAATGGYIYCVGGYTSSGPSLVNSTYYASITSSGVGAWTQTTSYPTVIYAQSCVASSGDIYCVAGATDTSIVDEIFYSPSSSSQGLGTWTSAASYPSAASDLSCVASGGDIYCTGGASSSATSPVYYASVSAQSTSTTSSTLIATTASSTNSSTPINTTITSSASSNSSPASSSSISWSYVGVVVIDVAVFLILGGLVALRRKGVEEPRVCILREHLSSPELLPSLDAERLLNAPRSLSSSEAT